jgi:hypothetical protein
MAPHRYRRLLMVTVLLILIVLGVPGLRTKASQNVSNLTTMLDALTGDRSLLYWGAGLRPSLLYGASLGSWEPAMEVCPSLPCGSNGTPLTDSVGPSERTHLPVLRNVSIARSYICRGDLEHALGFVEEHIEQQPILAGELGDIYYQLGDGDRAFREYASIHCVGRQERCTAHLIEQAIGAADLARAENILDQARQYRPADLVVNYLSWQFASDETTRQELEARLRKPQIDTVVITDADLRRHFVATVPGLISSGVWDLSLAARVLAVVGRAWNLEPGQLRSVIQSFEFEDSENELQAIMNLDEEGESFQRCSSNLKVTAADRQWVNHQLSDNLISFSPSGNLLEEPAYFWRPLIMADGRYWSQGVYYLREESDTIGTCGFFINGLWSVREANSQTPWAGFQLVNAEIMGNAALSLDQSDGYLLVWMYRTVRVGELATAAVSLRGSLARNSPEAQHIPLPATNGEWKRGRILIIPDSHATEASLLFRLFREGAVEFKEIALIPLVLKNSVDETPLIVYEID